MFDDPHVLSVIIDTFLPDNQVLSSQMGEFKKAVDSFKSSAKMGYLVDLFKKNKQSKRQNCQIIRLKVQEHWNRCILKNFETAMKMLLGSLHRHLSYLSVDKGCYCISWIIVADILHASQALPKHSKEYFKIIGVISFQIGEEMVYDSNGKVQGCAVLEAAMLQAIELNNTQAIELLLAVGCSPEVATCKGHAVTNVLNIRERSVDDSSEGGVDHVCVLGHNEHIEAIVNTMIREKECVACQMKEKQIKQLHSMQFERKDHDEIQELTKKLNEKDAELTKLMEQLKFKDDGEAEDSTEQQLRSQVAKSASLISALTEQIKSKDLAFIALMGEKEQLKEELKHEVELKKKEEKKSLQKVQLEKDVKIQKWTEKLQEKDAELKKLTELLKGTRWPPTSDAYYCRHVY